jgi:hypothetical protein
MWQYTLTHENFEKICGIQAILRNLRTQKQNQMKRKNQKLRNTKSHTKKRDELFTGQSEPDFTTQTTKTMYQKATLQLMVR